MGLDDALALLENLTFDGLVDLAIKMYDSLDLSVIKDVTVSTFTIGGSNINVFVGVGPYFLDSNNDGRISMYEAFMYASALDSRLENPYYDDDGDGDGLPAILLALLDPMQEGAFGMSTFL